MGAKFERLFLLLMLCVVPHHALLAAADSGAKSENWGVVNGVITSTEGGAPIPFATIYVEQTNLGASSDMKGRYEIKLPQGEHKVVVSVVGYEEFSQVINIAQRGRATVNATLKPSSININAVEVRGESRSERVNRTAFNVQALPINDLKNTTANLSDALSRMNGIRIRESGGVGSDMKISLDGFTDSHVKIFIDGAPMDTSNKSFSLSNIPANFAERIEVYNGVAPIEFGSDALGGVINIVTRDQRVAGWDLDASYSYGSFNTHRSDLTFTHQFKNGIQYKLNAYQNYSDNNYKIDNKVYIYDGSSSTESKETYTVERFHDTYHNEAVIAEVGVRRKSWADLLSMSFNYSQYYREVQTGTKQDFVYGGRHREGYAMIPTVKYSMRDVFLKGLDLKANAAYNYGITTVVDTTVFAYNWFGDTQYQGSNRTYTLTQRKDNSWSVNSVATYKPLEAHTASLSYSVNSAGRVTRDAISGTTQYDDFADPQYTTKSVLGLSYMYKPSRNFDAQLFGKNYMQSNEGKTYDDSGRGTEHNQKNSYIGYGGAATYLFMGGFQAKASYELAYRLPTTMELFGDSDLEIGSINLRPESSDNLNASLSYTKEYMKHNFFVNGGVVYRMTQDYIIRTVSSDGETATYSNYGAIKTQGWNISLKYSYDKLLDLGGSLNVLDARDDEKYVVNTDNQLSLTYGQRVPNTPYKYASADGRLNFYDLISSNDHFYILYDMLYQYEFTLYWANFGSAASTPLVPTQLAHNVTLNYSIKSGKYNFSLECRNITDAKLYDNYSLQKAGRAFYGKVRVNFGNINN